MQIAILGYGVEGRSAFRFLRKKYPKAKIETRDQKYRKSYLSGLEKFDLLVRSPGIKYLTPEIQKAKKEGVEVSSLTKLFFRFKKGKIVGVTGTKGKGTTSTLIYNILKKSGKDVYLAGNIGYPALDILPKLNRNSVVVLELSSFQLQDLDCSPEVAIVLDIAPDHLDSHKTMREYVSAKSNIAIHQKKNNTIFFQKNNKYSKWIAEKSDGKRFAINTPQNSGVAYAVARFFGCSERNIKTAIKNFRGLPQHQEFIRKIDDVKFYNDSASTNPVSTKYALKTLNGPFILIAGGHDKGFDYSILKSALLNTRYVVLFGENKKIIARAIKGSAPVVFKKDITGAVSASYNLARPGDIVLFFPASASFDQFQNSKERGREFNQLVATL